MLLAQIFLRKSTKIVKTVIQWRKLELCGGVFQSTSVAGGTPLLVDAAAVTSAATARS